MQAERGRKIREGMAAKGIDALVLLGNQNVMYATGIVFALADGGRSTFERPVAVLLAGDEAPHVFVPRRERDQLGVELPADHVHGPVYLDFDEGVVLEITNVAESGADDGDGTVDPGEKLELTLTIQNDAGVDLDPAELANPSIVVSGPTVKGSLITPASNFLTCATCAAWASRLMFLWMMLMPPSWAMAMARRASLTVSIAAERIGSRMFRSRVRRVVSETSLGRTTEWAGTSETSS